MARLISQNLLELALDISPRDKLGVEPTIATIAAFDGDKYSAQQLLDIYNQGRMAFLNAAVQNTGLTGAFTFGGVIKVVGGTITFSGGISTVTVPDDFVSLLGLVDGTDQVPIIILPPALYTESVGQRNSHLIESLSAKQVYMFRIGNYFQNADSLLNGKTYVMSYVGLTLWILSDVTTSPATETIDDAQWPIIKELCVRISNRAGNAEISALAFALLGGRK